MKKPDKRTLFYCLLPLGAALLGGAIIPLNRYLWQMPEWISILLVCIIIGTNVLLWWKLRRKYPQKIILSLLGLGAAVLSVFGSYCNPYWNSVSFRDNYSNTEGYDTVLTQRQARTDLDFAYKYLKKLHPACYHEIPAEVEARYTQAVQRLEQADTITVTMLAQEVEGILSLLGDAHTSIEMLFDWHYMKYIERHNQAGDTLVAVNGMTFPEMLEQYSDRISYETESWGVHQLSNYISTAEGLAFLGIPVHESVRYTYETPAGDTVDEIATDADFLTWEYYASFNHFPQETVQEESFVSYEIDPEHDLAILTLTACINNEEYRQCLREMFTEVREQKIGNIVVDLTNNGGGNSSVATEFIKYLDVDSYRQWAFDQRLGWFLIRHKETEIANPRIEELTFDGQLYLLTSGSTFSSAMNFAEYVKDNQLGTIIGEASGNAPDSYGDISTFRLPHSGLFLSVSIKNWYRIGNLPGLIEPDIPCRRDEVWEYLFRQLDVLLSSHHPDLCGKRPADCDPAHLTAPVYRHSCSAGMGSRTAHRRNPKRRL